MKKVFLSITLLGNLLITSKSLANSNATNIIQNQSFVEIKGKVLSGQKALVGATVSIVELQLVSATNNKGEFQFKNIPKGEYTLSIQYTGMKSTQVKAVIGETIIVDLKENSIAIEGVQVVGERSNVKGATSTFISRQAIEHLQATSIAEVLQLLPGQTIANPSFSGVNSPSIRQVSDSRSGNVAALGTSVLVNGAQLSNNADMQAVNTATGGISSSFSNATGKGTDLRQLTADNVESIEIIRGIPSVEYGDLTSGVIDVKTKAAVQPLQAKFRLNPTLKQAWVGQGFGVGKDAGALFVDFDYTHAANRQIQSSESYQRFNTSIQYTNTIGHNKNLYTNTTLAFGGYYDDSKIDPDLAVNQVINQSENYDLRFSTNGRWNLDKKFARNINYVLSAQLGFQNGFQQQQTLGELSAVSTSLTDITQEVGYLPSSYLQKLYLKGKPLNLQARLSDNFYFSTGSVKHAFVVGGTYTLDKNFGEGKYFTDGLPPKVNGGLGFRPRKFSDIPAMQQVAFYVEDKLSTDIFGRPLDVVAGLRYDVVQPFRSDKKNALSPRINASYELFTDLKIRGGYGLSAKAPSLIYMYPDPVYVDVFSLNHYKQDPREQLAMMTTRVFSAENPSLEMVKSKKSELGLDYKKFSLTFYQEKVDNGLDMYQYYNFTTIPMYSVSSQNAGEKPVLSSTVKDSLFVVDYNVPRNNVSVVNKGVEFDFDFGRVQPLRTSFTFNGAYNYSKSVENNPFVYARRLPNQPYNKLGVFEGRGAESSRFVTTVRAIHQIPEIRLLVTLTAQTIWVDQHEYINYTSKPYGLIDIAPSAAGKVTMLSDQEIADIPASSGLYLPVADAYYLTESWKPLWLFNTKVTKEFGKNYGFSFYVNNITNNRPYVENTRYPNQYVKRNIPIFFGSELSIKF
ncbi:TonB-dependent receptor [Sphingobacterium bovistauri]|uniref:TonB-dependent receptor n=1 Tax=Sphingobacterium bovistauri TaxID=2781959 RepID=A0ABS7Z1I6_9SPHI|nr:TonB-dependent receptor [Sphingobacterium bovistauri]MCA5003991.1 TonB-dependent receptor [Sphingobacterium bovistauri]